MLILNETNYSNGKVTLYDNENNVVSNGHVEVYVGTNKVSTFSLDAYGQGTPSITAGIFYRFEVFDSVGELVSILEPVSLGELSGGGVTPAALEAETAARIAADDSLQGQINSKAYKSYVDDKLGQIAYDKRVIEAKINEEVTRAKDAEKANSDTIEEASNSIESHVSDKSNPHEVTAEQVGAYTKAHVDEKIKAITDLIPTAATPANQLADKAYVDFGVEQMAAKYLSATADGQPFSSYAQFQQGVFYYGGEVTEPTKNDYALVNGDETHDNAVTRYVFTTEWNFQYVVNNSPLNAEQLAALNSTINASKVGSYDSHIADTTKHITEAERTKWNAAVQPSQLATVATTGSYSDLTGKPTIPPAITVDSAMSSTSTNPVQNKVVNTAIGNCRTIDQDVSKGANLVVNGNGRMSSKYNWEQCDYYRDLSYNGSDGVFGFNNIVFSSEFISVDFNKKTEFSVDVKNLAINPRNTTHRIAVGEFDADKNSIGAYHVLYGKGTLTELSQDLNVGDTVVHLSDLHNENWLDTGIIARGFLFWGYKDRSGYEYPPETYSRFVYGSDSTPLWNVGDVNVEKGEIKLITPWSGKSFKAGSKLSRRNSGGNYPYPIILSFNDTDWHHLSGYMEGIVEKGNPERTTKFSIATRFIKIGLVSSYLSVKPEGRDSCAVFTNFSAYEVPNESKTALNLSTPRSLGVNLARTAASTFDGSANQLEIPVKGKLPDDNIASASTWNGKQDALSFTTADEITEILGGLE